MTESNNMEWKYDELYVDISDIENTTNYVSWNEAGDYDASFMIRISDEIGIDFNTHIHGPMFGNPKYHRCCNSQSTNGNKYISHLEADSIGIWTSNDKMLVCPVCAKIAKSNLSPEVKGKLKQYRTNITNIELANARVERRADAKRRENDRIAKTLDSICSITNAKDVDEAKSVFINELFEGGLYGKFHDMKNNRIQMMASALMHKMGLDEFGNDAEGHEDYEYQDYMSHHAENAIDRLTENAVIYRITGDKEGHFRQVTLDLFGVNRQTVYGMLKNSLGNAIIEIHGHEDVSGGEE